MGVPVYELHEVLRLQLLGRQVEDECIMRYISNPGNVDAIGQILGVAMQALADLERPSAMQCPYGFKHSQCKCAPEFDSPEERK
jgi:hypothetical protein